VTGNGVYAQKAVLLLKEFFLDEDTKMNPNLLYSQAIPGISTGRGIGIIDTLHLIDIPFAIEVLKETSFLKPEVYKGLKEWFTDYLEWMTVHRYGIDEMNASNNHSVCWCVQASVYALFTDNTDIVDFCRDMYKKILLPDQMAIDGSFPLELRRTKPYSYSIFVLDNMVTLCHLLSKHEDNLWKFTLEDGRSIRKGLDFLYPYLVDKNKWPYPYDVQYFDGWPAKMSFLVFAGSVLGESKFIKLWEGLEPEQSYDEVRRNIAICQPILWM